MSEDSIPVAVVEDVTLEVPEEPDREDDDHHVEVVGLVVEIREVLTHVVCYARGAKHRTG